MMKIKKARRDIRRQGRITTNVMVAAPLFGSVVSAIIGALTARGILFG